MVDAAVVLSGDPAHARRPDKTPMTLGPAGRPCSYEHVDEFGARLTCDEWASMQLFQPSVDGEHRQLRWSCQRHAVTFGAAGFVVDKIDA